MIKEEKQNEIPNYTTQDIVETPQQMEVVITQIRIKKGKDIFIDKQGEIKTDDPEKEFLVLDVENQENKFKTDYHMAKYDSKKVPDNSNLGKFIKRYGKLETGQKLFVIKNTSGYYDLIY